MASKGQYREYIKDKNPKQNMKPPQNEAPDEISLRDEIFQLKRQIMLLKKTNERNVIKVRKYEEEAKKKDRQIEQLMDPVKNGDVRKLLSTKGAALLLNLKEQNNTLIQMILDKDVQIRKLLADIKTSKLYASSRRTESYRNEIDRLRNLLIKSQNMMKESQETQRRSICVGGTPALEMTFSSDHSSPRDLEELQSTIQSLEMHMKYSNELLAKKNEQILNLTDQLNSYRCSTCRKAIKPTYLVTSRINFAENEFGKNITETDGSTISEVTRTNTYEIISPKSAFLFDKNVMGEQKVPLDQKRTPNSAPAGHTALLPDSNNASEELGRTPYESKREHSVEFSTAEESRKKLLTNGNAINKECSEEMWGETCQFQLPTSKTETDKFLIRDNLNRKMQGTRRNSRLSFSATDESDMETAEFEMMEKKIENDKIEVESPVKLKPTITNGYAVSELAGDLEFDRTSRYSEGGRSDEDGGPQPEDKDKEEGNGRVANEDTSPKEEEAVKTTSRSEDHTDTSEVDWRGTREDENVGVDARRITNVFNESEVRNGEYVEDLDWQSSVLTYDSESTAMSVQEVEVEAEINHHCIIREYAGSGGDDDTIARHNEGNDENGEKGYNDNDDDDDDVIIG